MATVEHVDRTLGSAAATEMLYRRHGSRVLRYCLRCLRKPADAEDALQQTFLQAHRALGHGVEPVAEATWLLTIARNVCLTRVDALRRRARVEFAEDPSVVAANAGADDAPPELSPEIVEALARLPKRQRQVLFLREWQELSYAEIAEVLGTTESAVETLLFRGRNALAVQLGAPRRRRRGFDLAAFLSGWARPFAGIAVPKLAAGAAAVVAVAAAGVATTEGTHRHGHQAPEAAAVVSAAVPVYAPAPVRRRPASPVRRHSVAARSVRHAHAVPATARSVPVAGAPGQPAAQPTVASGAGSGSGGAAVAPTLGGSLVPSSVAPTATPPAVPVAPPLVSPPPVLAPVVAPVTAAVDATVQTAVTAVPAAAATVDQVAQDVAATTQAASATVSSAVSKLLPGH